MSSLYHNKWLIFFVTTSSAALAYLDISVIPVAIPILEKEFSFSTAGGIWVLNAYLLALLSFFLISGKLTDLFGKRTIFLFGFALFGFSSILVALSPWGWWLIASRALQGVGAALNFSTNSAILIENIPLKERSRAIGLTTGISSIFLIAGPAVGGYFTEYLSWRYIFWVNVPIVIYGILIGYWILPKDIKKGGEFHILGGVLAMLAATTLVVALMQGSEWGWISLKIIFLFLLFIIFLCLFIISSNRSLHPIIDFSLFRNFLFNTVNLSIFFTQIILIFFVFLAIYLQKQLNYSPSEAGLIVLIGSLPVIVFAPLGGYLADHISPKLPMIIGFVLLLFAFLWLFYLPIHSKNFYFLIGLVIFGTGVSMVRPPALSVALHNISSDHMGLAVGIIKTNQQFAATLGLAMMTTILHYSFQVHHSYEKALSFFLWLLAGFAAINIFLIISLPKIRR